MGSVIELALGSGVSWLQDPASRWVPQAKLALGALGSVG